MRRIDTLAGFHRAVSGGNETQTAALLGITEAHLKEVMKLNDLHTAVFRTEGLTYKLYTLSEYQPKKSRNQ